MLQTFIKALIVSSLFIVSVTANAHPVSPKVKVHGHKLILPLTLNSSWAITVDDTDAQMVSNAEYLRNSLQQEFGLSIQINPYSSGGTNSINKIILGKTSNTFIKDLIVTKHLTVNPQIGSEGYVIESFQDPNIIIVANESAGVFYGIQSLLRQTPGTNTPFQLLYIDNGQIKLDGIYIADWPDKPVRGLYASRETCTNLTVSNGESCLYQDLMGLVDKMARWKMNFLVVGTRPPSTWQGVYTDLLTLYSHAREHYITPVPLIRGVGTAADFVSLDPNIVEGIPVKGESFRFINDGTGKFVLAPDKSVIVSNDLPNRGFESPVTVWMSDYNPGWYFTTKLLCPVGLPFCSSNEKIEYQQWEWTTNVVPTDSNTHSGIGAVKLSVSQSWADDYPGEFSTTLQMRDDKYIPVEGGKTYTISFWGKADGVEGAIPQVTISQHDANKILVAGTSPSVNTALLDGKSYDWRQYFVSINTAINTRFLSIYSRLRPGGYGAIWLDDFEVRRMDGALTNIVRTGDSDIVIKSADGQITYMEGIDYKVVNGVFKSNTLVNNQGYRFYPLNTPTQIELIDTGRIIPGQQLMLDYDFAVKLSNNASSNWASTYSINDARTYTSYVCPYIESLLRDFPSDYVFYMGADEIRGINRDSRNGTMENYELIAKDITNVYNCVKQVNAGARMFIWDDMFNPWSNGNNEYYQSVYGGKTGASEPKDLGKPRVTDRIPKTDLIPDVWSYEAGDPKGILSSSPAYFENLGFEWVASPHFNSMNIQEWAHVIADRPMNLGMIHTTWNSYDSVNETANHVWNNTQITAMVPDLDADGVLDTSDNCLNIANTSQVNTDGDLFGDICDDFPLDPAEWLDTDHDGIGNNTDLDDDNDGLVDNQELTLGTDPLVADTDGDGVNDGDEVAAGTDPLFNPTTAPTGDANGDGHINVSDLLIAAKILLGSRIPTSDELMRLDLAPLVNGVPAPDGQFNAGDYVILMRVVLGDISL